MKSIDDRIVENHLQINSLKLFVEEELNNIKYFLNTSPSNTNNNLVSNLKDEIKFLKNELASKNKIIEILHENSIRYNATSTQNFKNSYKFQTSRKSSDMNNKSKKANEFVLPIHNKYQCLETTENQSNGENRDKITNQINDDEENGELVPTQPLSNSFLQSEVRKRPSIVINHHEENQQEFRKNKTKSKIYSEAISSEKNETKKKTIIFTDSIPKGIRMKEFNHFIKNGTAQMKCFPGATSKDLTYYVTPTLENSSFDQALIHVGINDFLNCDTPLYQTFLQNVLTIAQKCKDSGVNEIIISSLVVTEKISLRIIIEANESLRNFCKQNGFNFIDNSNIPSNKLYRDKLHLIESGKDMLANNFIDGINDYFHITNFPITIF